MCYRDRCLLCIPVEKGCLVCAIIVAIGTGIILVISFIMASLTAAGATFSYCSSNNGNYDSSYRCTVNSGVAVTLYTLALSSAIGFAFAVVLCIGISKRQPGRVKAYFVYGVVVIVLSILTGIVMLCILFPISIAIFILCVPYSLFVVLVQHTYFKLLENRNGVVLKSEDLMEI